MVAWYFVSSIVARQDIPPANAVVDVRTIFSQHKERWGGGKLAGDEGSQL